MIIQTFETAAALAGALASRLRVAIKARPALVLGLPTGHTPLPSYAALRAETRERGIDWSGVRTFNLDEFVGLECGAPGSYRHYMDRELFGAVGIPTEHIGFLDGCGQEQPSAVGLPGGGVLDGQSSHQQGKHGEYRDDKRDVSESFN